MEGIINGFALKDYDALQKRIRDLEDELAQYRAKEDTLTDMITEELHEFYDKLKNDNGYKPEWISSRTLYISDICEKLGYMGLYNYGLETARSIAVDKAEEELFGSNEYQE